MCARPYRRLHTMPQIPAHQMLSTPAVQHCKQLPASQQSITIYRAPCGCCIMQFARLADLPPPQPAKRPRLREAHICSADGAIPEIFIFYFGHPDILRHNSDRTGLHVNSTSMFFTPEKQLKGYENTQQQDAPSLAQHTSRTMLPPCPIHAQSRRTLGADS